MIDRGIRCSGGIQGLAAMTFLPAGLLARAFSQAADAGRLLQTVAGYGLPLLPLFSPSWRSSCATRATKAAFWARNSAMTASYRAEIEASLSGLRVPSGDAIDTLTHIGP